MKIETKFNIGDKVFPIIKRRAQCPTCFNHDSYITYNSEGEHQVRELKIKPVNIKTRQYKIIYELDPCPDEEYNVPHYLVDESDVFATKEASQAECDRRNKETEENE